VGAEERGVGLVPAELDQGLPARGLVAAAEESEHDGSE
jgi:hypothetical protein